MKTPYSSQWNSAVSLNYPVKYRSRNQKTNTISCLQPENQEVICLQVQLTSQLSEVGFQKDSFIDINSQTLLVLLRVNFNLDTTFNPYFAVLAITQTRHNRPIWWRKKQYWMRMGAQDVISGAPGYCLTHPYCTQGKESLKGWFQCLEPAVNMAKWGHFHPETEWLQKLLKMPQGINSMLLGQSVTNTFVTPNTNTKYYSVFRNNWILNTKYYLGVRKSEYGLRVVVFGLNIRIMNIKYWIVTNNPHTEHQFSS